MNQELFDRREGLLRKVTAYDEVHKEHEAMMWEADVLRSAYQVKLDVANEEIAALPPEPEDDEVPTGTPESE